MFCKNCGKQINPNSNFCQFCGQSSNSINDSGVTNYTPVQNYNQMPNQMNNNSYNSIPNMPDNLQQPKSGNPILVMMVVVFIVLAIGIPAAVYLLSGGEESTETKENVDKFDKDSVQVITVNGYNFKIPKNYEYEVEGNDLTVYDDSDWVVVLTVNEYNYEVYKDSLEQIDAELRLQYENVVSSVEIYQNVEYIETNLTYNNLEARLLYIPIEGDATVLAMLMSNSGGTTLDELFKTIFPIIRATEKDDGNVL